MFYVFFFLVDIALRDKETYFFNCNILGMLKLIIIFLNKKQMKYSNDESVPHQMLYFKGLE